MIQMPVNKDGVLEDLHVLLSHNVIGDKQYASRYKGMYGIESYNYQEILKW